MSYDGVIEIDGKLMTKHYIESLGKEEREKLIEPIFQYFRKLGFTYPDDYEKARREYKRLVDYKCDLDKKELFNNSSLATYIPKLFCRSFYSATEKNRPKMIDIFNDDEKLRKTVWNRLGLDWFSETNQSFNISPKMIVQGFRSMRLIAQTSMYKPDIAKHLYLKYSNEGDICYDYSAGFGSRFIACMSAGRRYVGIDPLTIPELRKMAEFFGFKNYILIEGKSEDFRRGENSIDFAMSSPPYSSQEVYSNDLSQAYNNGDKYFFDTYWKNTLSNIYHMLKPGKIFALNVKNVPKMLEMAEEQFKGKCFEEIYLKTIRSHLNKRGKTDAQKMESVYIFKK